MRDTQIQTTGRNVLRGNGSKVHRAYIYKGQAMGTLCAANTLFGGRQDLRLTTTSAPVDCLACLGETAAPAHTDEPAPDQCPKHAGQPTPTVKTVKAGTKSEYPCGAIYWHGKGWDPKRMH